MKKLIGYAMVYKNRDSFVVVDNSFYKDASKLSDEAKEISQKLKKKVFIKKVYWELFI